MRLLMHFQERHTLKKAVSKKDWSNLEDLINAYQDMENDLVESISMAKL